MANIVLDFLHNYQTGERRESEPANSYQYDEGHVLEAVLPEVITSCEIHYWIRGMEEADAYTPTSITPNADNSCTVLGNIPNKYFETNGELRIYIVVTDGTASITTYEGKLHICQRSMPDDYVDDDPENEAVRVIAEARAAAATATEKAGEAAASAEQAQEILDSIPEDYSQLSEDVSNLNLEHINLFNTNTITEGQYIANDGSLDTNLDFFASDFIDVSEYSSITLSYTHIAHWYDSSKADISAVDGMNTVDHGDATVTVPSNAKYIRFSTYNTYLNLAQIGENVSRTNYIAYNYYRLPYLIANDSIVDSIIVDANGYGGYTSFTEAVYDNVDNCKDIVVKAGTYDIKAEYIALFGQSVVDNLSDSTSGINNFQYGVRIHDRKIVFGSGSHLVCDWTGHTVNETHRFCALRVEPNAELIGLDLDCTATFYCIHDDYGTNDGSPFTIKYENCRVIGHNLYNANCIGGGADKYSRHILKNCYFKNNVDSSDIVLSADVRYHNTNTAEAEPELYVSNCYFSNNMNVTYYGTQTTKFKAYVNNCFAPHGINKRAESSSMSNDNVELYTWNNQTN